MVGQNNGSRNRATAQDSRFENAPPVAPVHDMVRLLQHNVRPAGKKHDLKSMCVGLLKHRQSDPNASD